jgi:predicted kinase
MGKPTLIIVSGPGGSGKTTLAHQLAATLGCPALSRDEIKEGMVASNPGFAPGTSDQLTERTYDVFFEATALFLRAEVTLAPKRRFSTRCGGEASSR